MSKQLQTSVGPSGRNLDYFLKLCAAVEIISQHKDCHLQKLLNSIQDKSHDDYTSIREDLTNLVKAGSFGLPVPADKEGWEGVSM